MATLVRWDPLREIAALQNEMGRFMNVFRGEGGNGTTTGQQWVPALDVWETENDIVYAFDLPGIPEDKISIEFEDGALTVSAERDREQKVEGDRFYRYERRFGTFSRTIGLPQGVTDDSISAEYKNGVLEVHVTKPEQPKPKRIQIGNTGAIEGKSEKK
jgi:HSP20 family protein